MNPMNKFLQDPDIGLLTNRGPQQVDFISLVHNFTGKKTFKLNLRDYQYNFRLVPFSGDTYGLYAIDGARTFDLKNGMLITDYDGNSHEAGTPLMIIKYNKAVYESALETWTNFWTWKKNRNQTRSALEEQFGYDTKHAMHLVRLLRMGVEALEEGVLHVRRPDAAELLSIRAGAWTYEQIVEYAEEMDHRVREVLYPKTQLPKKADIKLAAEIVMAVQDAIWTKK